MDALFGTFREKLGESRQYKGQWKGEYQTGGEQEQKNDEHKPKIKEDVMVYKQIPGYYVYMTFTVVIFTLTAMACLSDVLPGIFGAVGRRLAYHPKFTASMLAYGPMMFGALLMKLNGDKASIIWPFHKDGVIGNFGIHVVVGFMIGVLPAYQMVEAYLGEPVYCRLHGC